MLYLSRREFTGNGLQQLRLLSTGPHIARGCAWSRLALQGAPHTLLFDLLSAIIFLHTPQEALLALGVFNVLNTYINSLGKNLALNLLVDNNAHRMLSDTVDSSGLAMVAFVGHSFLNSAHFLDVYKISFLIDLHIRGQRNNAMVSKPPRERIAEASPLSLCVSHFGELLEGGSSSQREKSCMF